MFKKNISSKLNAKSVSILFSLLAMVLVSASCSSSNNQLSSSDKEIREKLSKSIINEHPDLKTNEESLISLEDAKKAFDDKSAIFVDVRDESVFKAGHIQGAVNVPLLKIDTLYKKLFQMNKKIIFYCSCPAEQSSLAAVEKAKAKNNTNVAALKGGTQAWINAGYPSVESKIK